MNLKLTFLNQYRDLGLLTLRIGLGLIFIIFYGWPKLIGGPDRWKQVGAAMSNLGMDFFPVAWGFAAAFTETAGAALLIIGFYFRPACLLLTFTMLVATLTKLSGANGSWSEAAHPFSLALVFFALLFVGAGRYSVDRS